MKSFSILVILIFLFFAGITQAQNTNPDADPTEEPTGTDSDKKADFNYPQSPVRQPNSPSEDTLIKGSKPETFLRKMITSSADTRNEASKIIGKIDKKDHSLIQIANLQSAKFYFRNKLFL